MFQLDLDGKAAALGSLYSAYSNEFFDGISFWNNSLIEENKDILLQTSSNLGKRNLSPMTSKKKWVNVNVDPHNCISEQSSLVTSSEAEDGSELDAYISGGANLFGLLSATVTGSLKLLDKDKGIMNIFLLLLQ